MSSIKADFNRLALLDDEGWTANNHYHNFLLKHVPQNCENALEIGCGTGSFARRLAKSCQKVIALDFSPEMICVARSRSSHFNNLEFRLADAMTWNFSELQLDYVCSIATLHHLLQRELLVKMKDALKPGGVLVVLDLAKSNSLVERMLDVIALGVSGGLRLIHNGRLRPPSEVRKAWEQHGKHDSYSTVSDMHALANEILPGSSVRRHLLWRYTLVYQKGLPPKDTKSTMMKRSTAKNYLCFL
jgi:ubiquinone/menaquinone biosynthesis C-methylase UbiE